MKIIPENEVDEAADNEGYSFETYVAFKAGVTFAKSKVHDYIKDIIIENQGLKLYKDNEPKRFEELAVELAEWIIDYERTPHLNRLETIEELYEQFIKERNEK